MNKHIELISTVEMSENDWLNYRSSGVGASEVGAIMGLNQYKSSIQLYYEKIGAFPRYNIENIACFMGKEQEAFVADLWQYWGGTVESLISNYRTKTIVRKCRRANAYIRNPKFPHIFVSLDRVINKHGNKQEGSLEVKTIAGYESNKWEGGIPPSYIMQVQTQLGVCEFDYGEMAILTDGRQFEAIPFDFMPDVFDRIVSDTAEFWKRVEQGKIIVNQQFEAKRNFNNKLSDKLEAEIANLEPPPDGSDAYSDFLKQRHREATGYRKGTEQEFEWALSSKKVAEQIKVLSEEENYFDNCLKRSMADIQTIEFAEKGKVNFKFNVKGNRIFSNKVKV